MNWNERYEKSDTPWDKGTATPVLDEIAGRHPSLFTGAAIVPGCGLGYDARRVSELGCTVTAQDIAPLAVERARLLDPLSGVRYEVADFLNPAAADLQAFDVLFEHTCFCALDPVLRENYLRSATAVLKPGGVLIGVFFINPEMSEGESGPPFGIDLETLRSLVTAAGFAIVDSWTPAGGFTGRIGRERVLILSKTAS